MMPGQIRAIGYAVVLAFIACGLWYLHHDGYEAGKTEVRAAWEADRLRQDEAQKAALLAYAERIQLAEAQHDTDQATITHLADDARRVRIHLPACPASGSGADKDGAAGLLSARVDRLFAQFQERVGGLVTRCDQLNIDAIRANGSQ